MVLALKLLPLHVPQFRPAGRPEYIVLVDLTTSRVWNTWVFLRRGTPPPPGYFRGNTQGEMDLISTKTMTVVIASFTVLGELFSITYKATAFLRKCGCLGEPDPPFIQGHRMSCASLSV
jgi:hypothetical protein